LTIGVANGDGDVNISASGCIGELDMTPCPLLIIVLGKRFGLYHAMILVTPWNILRLGIRVPSILKTP